MKITIRAKELDKFSKIVSTKKIYTILKIELKKDIFDRSENDPRIYGVSSSQKNGITSVKKASFTSCKKNDDCPPWIKI